MKNNSRRIFLRDASLATTGVLIASPLAASKKNSVSRNAIGCAPGSINSLTGTISSVQSGKWSDPSTWGGRVPEAGDTPAISSGHTVDFDTNTTVSGVNINGGGVLQFDPSNSSELLSTQNIVVQGKLVMKPSSATIVQRIRFIGINENNFVGSGHDVLASDIGLWVMGAGQLDLSGARKKSWTRTTGSVSQGLSSFTVQDANGWAVGDEIVLVPTETPGGNELLDFDDSLRVPVDKFAVKFERRTIVAVSGNSITVNSPFVFDHNQVSTDSKSWTPEVANLSRNVRIEGTATGRSHIFIRSTLPQNIYYISGRYLGPRKSVGGSRPQLVSGRYGIHFHHCQNGSKGSIVEGCAIYDVGNRSYVPHASHGVTMKNNVAFNGLEAGFWWDFQEITHYTTWEGNLVALITFNGIDLSCKGMELNMGDGNVAKNNVVVYGHNGDEHNQGAYVWNANSEGVWVFENNLSHSNRTGIFVWQNTANNHTIVNHEGYNEYIAMFHGAYINSYTYTNCYFYNALVRVKATSGNSTGVRFERTVFDGGNKLPHVTEIFPSPVTSGDDHNVFRECTFKNYTESGLLMNTVRIADENVRKHVSLIKCNFSGNPVAFSRESGYDSKFYLQPASGPCSIISQAGVAAIGSFAPYIYGTGTGLKGEYYNGANFASHAFTRIDSVIMFQAWSFDINSAPTGVHHTISGNQFSVRWTGKIEAQYTEPYQFRLEGSGGFRLWINNVQVLNSWTDRSDAKDSVISTPVNLVAGEKYDIKLEHMNMDGARACLFFWSCPSLGRNTILVPQSQLYSDEVIVAPPPPVINHHPVANAGADITITLPVSKAVLDGSASAPKESIKTYEWTKVSGPDSANIITSSSPTTEVKDLVEGTYVFKLTVTASTGVATNDEVSVKVNPSNEAVEQPLVANAGSDVSIALPTSSILLDGSASSPKESIASCEWIKIDGPVRGNIANVRSISTNVQDLTEGIYVFKLQITDKNGKVAHDDIRVTVQPQPPTANAGSDVSINLPENSVVLNGSGSFAPVGIKLYDWSKVSGPNNFKILNKNAISPVIKDLEKGTYVFKLEITDKNGTTAVDEVTVTVSSTGSGNPEEPKVEGDGSIQLAIKAWPNPSSYLTPTYFQIDSNCHNPLTPITVTLYNQHGKMVDRWSRVPPGGSIKWSQGIKRGTYFVVAEQAHVRKTLQLLKL